MTNNPFAPQQGGGGATGGGNPFAPQTPPQVPQQPQQQPPPPQVPQQPQQNPGFGPGFTPPAAPPQTPAPPAQPSNQQPPDPSGFYQPGKGSTDAITGDEWKSYVGALVLFEVHEYRTGLVTRNTKPGETTDAVLADVHVIDVNGGPIFKERSFVFPPALVTATKEVGKAGGGRVLGRIGAYTTHAGRDTVELLEFTDADAQLAGQYLQWRAQQSMQQPAQQPHQTGGEPPF